MVSIKYWNHNNNNYYYKSIKQKVCWLIINHLIEPPEFHMIAVCGI